MKLRFYNAKILTPDGIIDGELRTEDDKIVYLSPVSTLDWQNWDREINLNGNLIIPSFKNAHTHSPMTFLRSKAEDMPLADWLTKQVFPAEAKLTDEDCYWLTRLAVAEYYEGGTTMCCEMYGHTESVGQAFYDTGFGAVVGSGIFDFDGNADDIIEVAEKRRKYFEKFGTRVRYMPSMHAQYTCGKGTVEAVRQIVEQYREPLFVHLCETKKEVADCIGSTGLTPVRYFTEGGVFAYGGTGFHCVYLSDDDIAAMKEYGINAVTCPCSNLKLASGIAPVKRILDSGIKLGVGTDGPASNNALDMFREVYLATCLQKYLLEDATAVRTADILKAATSADSFFVKNADGLYRGACADMAVIDLSMVNMQPQTDIVSNLVYAGGKQNVIVTVSGGRIVYEKGELAYEDKEKLLFECNRIAKRIADECAG